MELLLHDDAPTNTSEEIEQYSALGMFGSTLSKTQIRERRMRKIDKRVFFYTILLIITSNIIIFKSARLLIYLYVSVGILHTFLFNIKLQHVQEQIRLWSLGYFVYNTLGVLIIARDYFDIPEVWFQGIYALATGPILCQAWNQKYSLQFHCFNIFADFYFHVMPSILMFSLRWYSDLAVPVFNDTSLNSVFIKKFIAYTFGLIFCWAALYSIIYSVKKESRKSIDGLPSKNPEYSILQSILQSLKYTVILAPLSIIMFLIMYFNILWIAGVLISIIFSSGDYYIRDFPLNYRKNLNLIAESY